jgi:hexokinase
MAVDLGGTNFRVCSVQLHGNSTFSLTQRKTPVPQELMVAKRSEDLFAFLAQQIKEFLEEHHEDHYFAHVKRRQDGESSAEIFQLGFTFSFPVNQVGINKGVLMRWTKGFDIHDTVGRDVCALLQEAVDRLGLPVKVAALVNDTVGTLMARSYTSPGKTGTLLGAIFGTGTNGAYVEKLDKIKKLSTNKDVGQYDKSTGEMIVNTEWGSFDNPLHVLPVNDYDIELDKKSNNPGIQMFEKRISGMFLGELFRLAITSLMFGGDAKPYTSIIKGEKSHHQITSQINQDSPLFQQWGVDTSFLSICAGDNTPGLTVIRQTLDREYGVPDVSVEDAEAMREIAAAVGRRAARLSAVAIAGIVINTGKLDEEVIDIGVDGSLVEFYPGFEAHIREALREVEEIGEKVEPKIRIGIAKDGSGVGASLIALVAANMPENQ